MTKRKPKPSSTGAMIGESAYGAMPTMAGVTYNPDSIPLNTYIQMEDDAQIKAVLTIVKAPIMNVVWSIACKDKDISQFCRENLEPLWGNLVRNMLNALNFGWQGFEKIWEKSNESWIYKDFQDLYHGQTDILKTDKMGFGGLSQSTLSRGTVTIPIDKSFVFTHEKRFGNLYGRSKLRSAYSYWFIDKYTYDFENQFYERYAIPILHGQAPSGVSQTGGDAANPIVEDNLKLLLNKLQGLRSATCIVTPSDVGINKEQKWKIDVVESARRGADFTQRHNQLDAMKARAIFAPELVFSTPQAGSSYALAREHATVFMGAEEALLFDIKTHIDKYILPQLVLYNFGSKAPRAEWTFESISVETKNLMRDLVLAMVSGELVRPDPDWLTKSLKIKLREEEEKPPTEPGDKGKIKTKITSTKVKEGRTAEKKWSRGIKKFELEFID